MTKPIAGDDIEDDEIADHLLAFNESVWDFDSVPVEVYRALSSRINHAQMLPHPISIAFPQYFSSMVIPPKTSFLANVLPPDDRSVFPTSIAKMRVRIIVEEMTTTELIAKCVSKLEHSLTLDSALWQHQTSEFILKVVGSQEV